MKRTIFVDTSAFIALLDKDESFHAKCKDFFVELSKSDLDNVLVTTDYVLSELFTWMRCTKHEPVAKVVNFLKDFKVSDIELVGITKPVFDDAFELMVKFNDQYFSFTDCVSFVVMKDLNAKEALTLDKHFKIAGFNNLLEVGL